MISKFNIGTHNIFGASFNHIKEINADILWLTFLCLHFQIRVKNKFVEFLIGIGLKNMLFKIKLNFSA